MFEVEIGGVVFFRTRNDDYFAHKKIFKINKNKISSCGMQPVYVCIDFFSVCLGFLLLILWNPNEVKALD